MPITIELPDGTTTQPTRRTDVNDATNLNLTDVTNQQIQSAAYQGIGQQPRRTIAVVAAELERAISSAANVRTLTDELHALLGKPARKPRTPKAK